MLDATPTTTTTTTPRETESSLDLYLFNYKTPAYTQYTQYTHVIIVHTVRNTLSTGINLKLNLQIRFLDRKQEKKNNSAEYLKKVQPETPFSLKNARMACFNIFRKKKKRKRKDPTLTPKPNFHTLQPFTRTEDYHHRHHPQQQQPA